MYSVRCRNASCRHRRVSKTHPDDYKVTPRCDVCGERKGWRIEVRDYNKRDLCKCSGPEMCKGQNFPHNTTHPLCNQHPLGPRNQLKRQGVSDEDLPIELMGVPVESDDAPF